MPRFTKEGPALIFTEADSVDLISKGQSFIIVGNDYSDESMIIRYHSTITPETILNVDSIGIKCDCSLYSNVPLGQLGNPLSINAILNCDPRLNIYVYNGHSLCITQNLIPVTVQVENGTLTLEDVTHSPVGVDIHIGSTINVTHNGNHYTFQNDIHGDAIYCDDTYDDIYWDDIYRDDTYFDNTYVYIFDDTDVYIRDVNKFVTICSTVNELIQNTTTDNPFPLEMVCFLRDYQKLDHSLVEVFMVQNNMLPTTSIDAFIAEHFFEFDAIAHSLEGSILLNSLGNYDPIQMICSYLDLEDVNYKYTNLAGDNNQNPDGEGA